MDTSVALLAIAAVVLLVSVIRLSRTRMLQRREENRTPPPLIYPAHRGYVRPAGAARQSDARSPSGDQVTFNSTSTRLVTETTAGQAYIGAVRDGGLTGDLLREPLPAANSDATIQLLPGRLEPVNPGMDQEIRFVRVPGMKRFTLGRNPGPTHSHIQLHAATASRMHAYMEFDGGRWQVGNMSETNAVVVNGAPLNNEGPRYLDDGDRIEFGELVFLFRER